MYIVSIITASTMARSEFLQIDTTNILFICGGAFDGLEKIIESRVGQKTIGFNGDVTVGQKKDIGVLLRQVLPQDLIKFGMIPQSAKTPGAGVSSHPAVEPTQPYPQGFLTAPAAHPRLIHRA